MTTQELHARASAMAERWRAKPHNTDRVNRALGRAEVIITRHAARAGDVVPALYVSSDGQWLTTWPGQRVARLYVTGKARGFNCELTCYSAIIEGRNYYGRGLGPGMYLRLHAGRVKL
jgi:hypothetical protein